MRAKGEKKMLKLGLYLLWVGFYFLVYGPFYVVLLIIASLPVSEKLWRWASGIRPLRIKAEKERLLPLLEEVYRAYVEREEEDAHVQKINLFIQESMTINAQAFGRETIALTKGAIDLLSDEDLKGLIAHELAHHHNHDAKMALFMRVANFPIAFLMNKLRKIHDRLESGAVKFFFSILFAPIRLIAFVGDLILMYHSRQQEYYADVLALIWGYDEELANVLIQIYQISMEEPQSVSEMIRATHPPITKRIEQLETIIH